MRIGEALHCEIRPSVFARKNYFYPDQAKDYQISQYDLPLNADGWLELPDGSRVGVTRAHMEEDTGKLTHVGASGRINAAEHALVDYNRSGVPLVEIVSEPDIRSAAQARAYAAELRGHPRGHGRLGRPHGGGLHAGRRQRLGAARGGDAFGTRCEIKNLNSLRSLGPGHRVRGGRARSRVLEGGGAVDQETRHWDESAGRTDADALEGGGQRLPLLPRARPGPAGARRGLAGPRARRPRARCRPTGVPRWSTALGGLAERRRGGPDPRRGRPRPRLAGDVPRSTPGAPVAPGPGPGGQRGGGAERGRSAPRRRESFAALLAMEAGGQLSATQSKAVLGALLERGGGDPAALAEEMGFEALERRHAGRGARRGRGRAPRRVGPLLATATTSCMGFFTGKVMQATSGKANGKEVAAELAPAGA